MQNKQHLTTIGFELFLSYYAGINSGIKTKKLLVNFPQIKPIEKPEHFCPKIFNPYWVLGFVAGDGGVFILIFVKIVDIN
jgi:hypothetical protein